MNLQNDRQIQRMRKEQVMCITICNDKFQKAKIFLLYSAEAGKQTENNMF